MKCRLLSVLLTFATFISCFSVPAAASDIGDISSSNDAISFSDYIESADGEKQFYNEKTPELTSSILQYISADDLQISDLAFRIPEQEELNTFVFQRNDGARVVYILDENVKFVDDSGKIIEKDITLAAKKDGYGITKSDIDVTIPADLDNGVSLSYGNYNVRLYPQDISDSTLAEKINNSVVYSEAFGSDVKLKYTPTLSGLKEDIILEQFVSNPSYTFTLKTDGLFLYENTEGYYLAVDEKSDPTFYLGNIIVYDAVGKPEMGTASIVTISDGFEYNITISVDVEYLSDPTTVYPVTIDPSITISDTTNGSNAIEDSPIYSGYPNRNFATYLYNPAGTADSDYGIGRTVVRLNGLINSSIYSSITASQITSVTFNVKEASGSSSQYVNLYPLTSNTTWTESTVTWNNVGSYSTSVNYGASMTNGQWTSFNITNLVKAWKNGTYSSAAGFILKNQTESNKKNFYSSEYSTSSYRPYVVLTYTANYSGGSSFSDATVLTLNEILSVKIDLANEKKYFKFTPSTTGMYSLISTSNLGDPKATIYNSSYQQLDDDDDHGMDKNFCLTYHLMENKTYYFSAYCFSTGTGFYDIKISYANSSSYIDSTNLTLGETETITLSIPQKINCYSTTPTETKEYLFFSSNKTSDPELWIYDSSFIKIDDNDDGGQGLNFWLSITLTAGKTYYIVSRHHNTNVGSYSLNTFAASNIPTNIYFAKNIGSSRIIDIEGPSTQEWIHQWNFHTNSQSKWEIKKQSGGFYTLQSEYGDKKYIGISNSSVNENNIKLYKTISDSTLWKIYENYAGEMIFEPKNAVGKILFAPNDNNGTRLQLTWAGSTNENEKWTITHSSALKSSRVPSTKLTIQCKGTTTTNSTWYPLIQSSVAAWNSSKANTSITLTTKESSYTCEVNSFIETWYGLTTSHLSDDSDDVIEKAEIKINSSTLPSSSNTRKSTITHEIGHLLGLADNPPVSKSDDSLMSHGRDRGTIYVPQKYDIDNVLFAYDN